jgi:hypothetical protein
LRNASPEGVARGGGGLRRREPRARRSATFAVSRARQDRLLVHVIKRSRLS